MAATQFDAVSAITRFNAGREPERLAMKYAGMRADAFRFLRGTCHLFHQRLAERKAIPSGPAAWLCGDLHLENFGTYLGDNGLTYFDVNDFDEAYCAAFPLDILRLATSVLVAGAGLGLRPSAPVNHAARLIEAYFTELAAGKPRWVERRVATGPVGGLMAGLKKRDPAKFLAKRTVLKGAKRVLLTGTGKALGTGKAERAALAAFLPKALPAAGTSYTLVDAARRIAGTGSLGIARFVILADGPDGLELLDLKEAKPSALAASIRSKQPSWPSEAHRVVAVQTLFQANTPGLLRAVAFDGGPFILKQMQPSADRLDLALLAGDDSGFAQVLTDMARLTAWGHLRSSGRYGSAPADDLIAAAHGKGLVRQLLDLAQELARVNASDWSAYCTAYDAGAFGAAVGGAAGAGSAEGE